jgi:hypothetical protein
MGLKVGIYPQVLITLQTKKQNINIISEVCDEILVTQAVEMSEKPLINYELQQHMYADHDDTDIKRCDLLILR